MRIFGLISIWLIVTALNITKPVHIDDTAHLEAAQHIMDHPLTPLSGMVNWSGTPEKIYALNNPPLLFYFLALTWRLFGKSEIWFHAMWSLFSLIAIVLFHCLAKKSTKFPLRLTAIFALGPAFCVSQNLMLDVPLIGIWLGFVFTLVKADEKKSGDVYWMLSAGLLLGIGILSKYTSLALAPVFVWYLASRRTKSALLYCLVPIGLVIAWSWWNIGECGSIHILSRNALSPNFRSLSLRALRPMLWIVGLGSVSLYSLFLIKQVRIVTIFTVLCASILCGITGYHAKGFDQIVLGSIFFYCGLMVILAAWKAFNFKEKTSRILLFTAGSGFLFIVLFSPFMAIRHILMSIPFLLLIIGSHEAMAKTITRAAPMLINALLGLALGVSDYVYADVNRDIAPKLMTALHKSDPSSVWFTDHWGWQWYAKKAGMKQWENRLSDLKIGDYIVEFRKKDSTQLEDSLLKITKLVDSIIIPGNILTYPRTMSPMGFYGFARETPWRFSKTPLAKLYVFRSIGEYNSIIDTDLRVLSVTMYFKSH